MDGTFVLVPFWPRQWPLLFVVIFLHLRVRRGASRYRSARPTAFPYRCLRRPSPVTMSFRSMSSFDSLESVITVNWPSTHTELRDAIFHLLLNDRLYGIRCSADQLVTALNSLGGADGREDVLLVDEHFRGGGKFSVPYNNPIIDIDKGGKGWFNARVNMYVGSSRAGSRRAITDFGYFRSEFEGVLSYRSVGPDVHPLDNWQRYKNKIDIPVHVKQSLNLWLKQRKADKLRREKRNKKYKGPRGTSPKPRSVSPKPKPTESSKRQLSPSKSAKKDVPQSESSNLAGSPPHPASKKPRDTNTADLMEEYERKQAEMNQLEEQIRSRLVLEGISASVDLAAAHVVRGRRRVARESHAHHCRRTRRPNR